MTTQVKWNKLHQFKCLQRIELFSLKMVLFALIFGAMPCSFAQDKVSDYPITDVENAAYTETKIAAPCAKTVRALAIPRLLAKR